MPSGTYFKTFMLVLGFVFIGIANSAFSASSNEPEKILLSLSDEPEVTFTMPMKSTATFFLLTNSKTSDAKIKSIGQIIISDKDCSLGHQASIFHEKKRDEILAKYFPKEIPWGTTYKLKVSRDAKTDELIVNLNGDITPVKTYSKIKFIYLAENSSGIKILKIEKN